MICTDEKELADIIASRIKYACISCEIRKESYSLERCPLFRKDLYGIDRFNDRLPECKEMFKEVGNERD